MPAANLVKARHVCGLEAPRLGLEGVKGAQNLSELVAQTSIVGGSRRVQGSLPLAQAVECRPLPRDAPLLGEQRVLGLALTLNCRAKEQAKLEKETCFIG
jgi:hypothetical protein